MYLSEYLLILFLIYPLASSLEEDIFGINNLPIRLNISLYMYFVHRSLFYILLIRTMHITITVYILLNQNILDKILLCDTLNPFYSILFIFYLNIPIPSIIVQPSFTLFI